MKKLFIDKNCFSFRNKFAVTDEEGKVRYTIEGKKFALANNVVISNDEGLELARINEKWTLKNVTYELMIANELITSIQPKYSWTKMRYEVENMDIDLVGNLSALKFAIMKNEEKIGEISTKASSMFSKFVVDCYDDSCELLILSLVLAVSFSNSNMLNIGLIGGVVGAGVM